MANKIDPDIRNTIITDSLCNVINRNNFPIWSFSVDISNEYRRNGDIVGVPFVDGVGDPIFNNTDWEQSDLKMSKKNVTLIRISRPMELEDKHLQDGHSFEKFIKPGCITMANGVHLLMERSLADTTLLNIGADDIFGHEILNTKIWPRIYRNDQPPSAFLSTEYYSRLIKKNEQDLGLQSSAFQQIGCYNRIGASQNFVGLALNSSAFVLANRLPHEAEPNEIDDYTANEVITIPGIGIKILYTEWSTPKTRKRYCSLDTLVGIERAVDKDAVLLMSDDQPYVPKKLANVDQGAA